MGDGKARVSSGWNVVAMYFPFRTQTGWPSARAKTSTVLSSTSIIGARMKDTIYPSISL